MQLIQRISLPYVSPNDLPVVAIVPGNRRNEKDNKMPQKKEVGVPKKAYKNNSAGKFACQIYFDVLSLFVQLVWLLIKSFFLSTN